MVIFPAFCEQCGVGTGQQFRIFQMVQTPWVKVLDFYHFIRILLGIDPI